MASHLTFARVHEHIAKSPEADSFFALGPRNMRSMSHLGACKGESVGMSAKGAPNGNGRQTGCPI